MYVYYVYVWYPWRPEGKIDSLKLKLEMAGYEPLTVWVLAIAPRTSGKVDGALNY